MAALSNLLPENRELLRQRLAALLERGVLPSVEQARLGDLLSVWGDPRPGTGIRPGNPMPTGAQSASVPDLLWVKVALGRFAMGEEGGDPATSPQSELVVDDFYISRYPITHAQYDLFVQREGYSDKRYWSPEGWAWRIGKREPNLAVFSDPFLRQYWQEACARRSVADRARPFQPGTSMLRLGNRPVVGVSWYEAMAYCRWLTEILGFAEMAPAQVSTGDRGTLSLWQDGAVVRWPLLPDGDPGSQEADDFAEYEMGLSVLLRLLEQRGSDVLQEALLLQYSLTENLAAVIGKGDTPEWRDKRVQLVERLDRLAVRVLGLSFKDLCTLVRPILVNAPWVVDLPSEAQWEKAARGPKGWKWPWADSVDSGTGGEQSGKGASKSGSSPGGGGNRGGFGWPWANTREAGIGTTCAVGCFPQGASKYGCLDMVGNAWEWTRSKWGTHDYPPDYRYPYREDDGREEPAGPDLRAIRGGGWPNKAEQAHCATRWRTFPECCSGCLGFRVVLHQPSWGQALRRVLTARLADRGEEIAHLREIQELVHREEVEEALSRFSGMKGADETGPALVRKWDYLCRERGLRGKDTAEVKAKRKQIAASVLEHTTAQLRLIAEPETRKQLAFRVLLLCPSGVSAEYRPRLRSEVQHIQEALLAAEGVSFEVQQRWEVGESGLESSLHDGPQVVHFPTYGCPDGRIEDDEAAVMSSQPAISFHLAGLAHLLNYLDRDTPSYRDALTYYEGLRENSAKVARSGDSSGLRQERERIVRCLDDLARETLSRPFEELCYLGWPLTVRTLHRALQRLQQHAVRCVVLNGLRVPEEQSRLLAEHVDCSVGVPLGVKEQAAIDFVTGFYQGLAGGVSVQKAYDKAWARTEWAPFGTGPQLYERQVGIAERVKFVPSEATAPVQPAATTAVGEDQGSGGPARPWIVGDGAVVQPRQDRPPPRPGGTRRLWIISDKIERGELDEALEEMSDVEEYRPTVDRQMIRMLVLKLHIINCSIRQGRKTRLDAKPEIHALAEEARQLLGSA